METAETEGWPGRLKEKPFTSKQKNSGVCTQFHWLQDLSRMRNICYEFSFFFFFYFNSGASEEVNTPYSNAIQ